MRLNEKSKEKVVYIDDFAEQILEAILEFDTL